MLSCIEKHEAILKYREVEPSDTKTLKCDMPLAVFCDTLVKILLFYYIFLNTFVIYVYMLLFYVHDSTFYVAMKIKPF